MLRMCPLRVQRSCTRYFLPCTDDSLPCLFFQCWNWERLPRQSGETQIRVQPAPTIFCQVRNIEDETSAKERLDGSLTVNARLLTMTCTLKLSARENYCVTKKPSPSSSGYFGARSWSVFGQNTPSASSSSRDNRSPSTTAWSSSLCFFSR